MPNSTKAITEITDETKQIVLKRQGFKSISGVWIGSDIHNCDFHHVVVSGLGIKGIGLEYNVVALTRYEHRQVHDHKGISLNGHIKYSYEEFTALIKNHLKLYYPNWAEQKCKVKKGFEKEDYENLFRVG